MRCPTCGFSIDQANLTQCPHCGNVLPSPAGQMEHASQGAQGPMPPEYQPYPSYAPCPPPVNYPGTYGASAPPSGYGPYYGQAAPPSYPMTPGYPQPRYPQPLLAPLPVRKRRTGLIVGIVAAVVVVLAACTGVTAFALNAAGRTTTPAAVGTATLASGTSSPGTSTTCEICTDRFNRGAAICSMSMRLSLCQERPLSRSGERRARAATLT